LTLDIKKKSVNNLNINRFNVVPINLCLSLIICLRERTRMQGVVGAEG